MKKLTIFTLVFLMTVGLAAAATITRNVPSRADPGSDITVTLSINSIQVPEGKTLAFVDILPAGLTAKSWDITGSADAKADISVKSNPGEFGLEFTPSGTQAAVTYTIAAPGTPGPISLGPITWFDQSGMSPQGAAMATIAVRTVTCGDGICEGSENSDNCEADCPKPAPVAEPPEPSGGEVPEALEPEKSASRLWIILLVVVIIAAGIYMLSRKKQ
ncbi:MAG: hypothetical protein ABH879_02850 [archaeon]